MKFKFDKLYLLFLPLFLFFFVMFYIEVSLYSLLPPEEGGMSFWLELQYVWYRSVWFYAMIVTIFFWCFLGFLNFIRKG